MDTPGMSPAEDTRVAEPRDATEAEPGLSRHLYPASAMRGDYLRAAAGLVPSGVLLATVQVGTVAAVVLGGFAAVFAVFGARTILRHATSIEMTERELHASGPRQASLRWADLDRMRLAYYSTRRDRRAGWMQLELGAGRTRLRLDSRIEGFDELVRHAARVAAANGVEFNEATVANLQAMGIKSPYRENSW
jgi:hypothetical protein